MDSVDCFRTCFYVSIDGGELHLHYILVMLAQQQTREVLTRRILQKLSKISVVSSRATGTQNKTEMQ